MKNHYKHRTYIISIDPPLPAKKSQIAVAPGDIHAGSPHNRTEALCELFVTGHIAKNATVIILGDLIDSWICMLFSNKFSWSDWLFFRIMQRRKGILVAGNHDWFLVPFFSLLTKATRKWKFPKPGERFVVAELAKKVCYFEHGDHYDGIVSHWIFTMLSYVFIWVKWTKLLSRPIHQDRQHVTIKWKRRIGLWQAIADRVARGTITAARQYNADFAAAGHTHFPEVRKEIIGSTRINYANAGCFVGSECHLLCIWIDDADELQISLHTIITSKGPLPRNKK